MTTEAKAVAAPTPTAHQPVAPASVAPAQPLATAAAQPSARHSAAWQAAMDTAFATFLEGINTQLLQTGQITQRPIVLSYADTPEESFEGKTFSLPKTAHQLKDYLSAAGLQVILNPIDVNAPQAQIAALKDQLDQHPDTQVIVLSTLAYKELANQHDKLLNQILVGFGKDKKDSLLLLMCLGGSSVASAIIPRHFLFRDGKSLLREFDDPQGGMPVFLDMFGDLSGKSGLGLLPDLLDLESTHSDQQPTYAQLFTELSQTQARLTTDHVLEENLDGQLQSHPLHAHYPETQGMHVEASAAEQAVEEKQAGVPDVLANFLSNPSAKTALLLAPTVADTELSGLAVVEMLRQQPSHPRVIAIDLAQFPGRAAHQCVALTLRHTLKLASPIIQQLQQHRLGEETSRPTVFVFKNYQHTGTYDNLYIQNALANWPNAKVVVTCTGDYFNRHDPAVCFLSDPTSPDRSSLQQVTLAGFATQAAQAETLKLTPKPLENLDALLADSGLTPKQQAQQYELDRFLDRIKPLIDDARNTFISYAWEPAAKDLAHQQRHLRQIAQDLGRAGFPTWLDIERMTGDINAQMAQNIQNSHYALIIGTPRYTQRATVLDRDGKPTNVKREYDDILKGHREGKLEALALHFLPEGPFDGGKADSTGRTDYPSFPDTLPRDIPNFNLLAIDDFETYIQCLADEQHGLLPQLLHLATRSPEDQQTYQTAKAALTEALTLLPAQHLIVVQAEQDQRIYEVPQRRSLYIEARGRAENKGDSPEFGLTAQFDTFLSIPVIANVFGEATQEKTQNISPVEESKDDAPSPAQATTFIALGEGGSGKSLFSQIQYARLLEQWQAHKKDPASNPRPTWIPIYIPLKHYVGKYPDTPENQRKEIVGQPRVNTCVEAALREVYHLDDSDVALLKAGSGQGLGVLLILDGYDELGGETPHLYNINGLTQWTCPIKLLVTSRVDYIPDPEKHKGYFATQDEGGFVRGYIQPFSAEDIKNYIQLYEAQVLIQQSQAQAARDGISPIIASALFCEERHCEEVSYFDATQKKTQSIPPKNSVFAEAQDTYQTLSALPGLLELVKNPFLLNLVLQGLPYLLAERSAQDNRPVTRLAIYDSFSQYWFGKEVYRLVKRDDPELRLAFEQHAERLAFQLFLNQQLSVSQKRPEDADLWGEFFNASDARVGRARAALPLRDAGDQQYEFMHKTLFEYFVTRHLVNAYRRAVPGQPHPNPIALGEALAARPPEHKARRAAGVPLPVQDAGVFSFLGDTMTVSNSEVSFKAALFEQVTRSATPQGQVEPETGGPLGLAAAHAATILTKTGTSMSSQAWPGVQVPGADLGLASLGSIDLSGANLQGAYLVGTFLHGADLSRANLVDVRFMEYPKIDLEEVVRCLALYPSHTAGQGKPWIVVGQGNQVVIIDSETRQIVSRGEGHTSDVTCVAFSPAGDRVVSGSEDNTLRLWSVGGQAQGELAPQAVLRGHEGSVKACAFSPAGDCVVSASQDKTLRLWAVGEQVQGELAPQAVLRGHERPVNACAFSPAGDRVVSGSEDNTLRLWSVGGQAQGELAPQAVLRGHEREVSACAFSPADNRVVSGSKDKTLRLWSVGGEVQGELAPQAVLSGHEGWVTACAFSPAGDCVVSGSKDKTLRLWFVGGEVQGELAPQAVLRGHEREVKACAFSPTGDRVVSGSKDKTLRLWSVSGQAQGDLATQAVLRGHVDYVNACAFSPAGDRVVSGSSNTLRLWSVSGQAQGDLATQAVLRGHEYSVNACAFSPAGDRVVSGGGNWNKGELLLWSVGGQVQGELAPQAVLRGHENNVRACAFSPAGDRVVSGGGWNKGELLLWAVGVQAQGELTPQAVLSGHEGWVTACAFSPAGDRVVSGGGKGELLLWAVGGQAQGNLAPQAVLRGHEDEVTACAFSPAGDRVVSAGGYDKTLRLWDVSDIKRVSCLQVIPWCTKVMSLDIHPKNFSGRFLEPADSALVRPENKLMPVRVVVGDSAGLVSVWQLDAQQLHFVSMPLQPGMTNVWRWSWQTVKLAGTKVTAPVKASLEQYRGAPLQEGVGEGQVRLVSDVTNVMALTAAGTIIVPAGSGLLAMEEYKGGLLQERVDENQVQLTADARALPVKQTVVTARSGALAGKVGVFKPSKPMTTSHQERRPNPSEKDSIAEPLLEPKKSEDKSCCCVVA